MFSEVWRHPKTVIAFAGLIATAMAKTMPAKYPWSAADVYYWFYDSIHQFFNLPNARLSGQTLADPPSPASNQK